jgi:hypothetical protein
MTSLRIAGRFCLTYCSRAKKEEGVGGSGSPRPPLLSSSVGHVREECVMRWDAGEVRPLAVEALGERYRRYRLSDPAAEEAAALGL